MENIALGIPLDQIDLDRVIYCAEKAKIRNFIEKQPYGFKGKVGERVLI